LRKFTDWNTRVGMCEHRARVRMGDQCVREAEVGQTPGGAWYSGPPARMENSLVIVQTRKHAFYWPGGGRGGVE